MNIFRRGDFIFAIMYRVGDKVKVRDYISIFSCIVGILNERMLSLAGKTVTIESVELERFGFGDKGYEIYTYTFVEDVYKYRFCEFLIDDQIIGKPNEVKSNEG